MLRWSWRRAVDFFFTSGLARQTRSTSTARIDVHGVSLTILGLVAIPCAAALAAPGETTSSVELTLNGPSYHLPLGTVRRVYRQAQSGPAPVEAFWSRHGREWQVVWDEDLRTPRLVYPLGEVTIAPPFDADAWPSDEARVELVQALEVFVDDNRDFFGCGSENLEAPYLFRIGANRIAVFRQTTSSGLPVRGAHLRVVILPDGRLYWLEAYLLRRPPEVTSEIGREQAEATARLTAAAVHSSELQLGFPGGTLESAEPIWCVATTEADDGNAEHFVSAIDGELYARVRTVKFFEANGQVQGRSPARDDIYSTPQTLTTVLSPLDGVVLRDGDGNELTTTARDGTFTIETEETPEIITASLEHGVFVERADGSGRDYRPVVKVQPWVPDEFGIRNLDTADDVDKDGVPDREVIAGPTSSSVLFEYPQHQGDEIQGPLRHWWLQTYHAAMRMLTFSRTASARFQIHPVGDTDPFHCVSVQPNQTVDGFSAVGAGEHCSKILTAVSGPLHQGFLRTPGTFDAVPTRFMHEFGHYLIFDLMRTQRADPEGIEEGIADSLAALTNDSCQIGFEAPDRPQAWGFCLNETASDPGRGRESVGDVFWRLHEHFRRRPTQLGIAEPDEAAGLLYHLVAYKHSERQELFGFEDKFVFALKFFLTDDLVELGGDNLLLNGTPRTPEIFAAFRGKLFLDAPFIRGDTNLDRGIDVSDAIQIFSYLFVSRQFGRECLNALDVNDSGDLDISDGIALLNFLFVAGFPPPAPFPDCGLDPEAPEEPGNLGCVDFVCPQ